VKHTVGEQRFQQIVRRILAERQRATVDDEALIRAAVLVPLVRKDGEWHVLVTKRTQKVEHHKGQISFPGGAWEPGDADLKDTALRETYEEIGLSPESVQLLGVLDDCPTITGFAVTPFVGVIPPSFDYRLNAGEVSARTGEHGPRAARVPGAGLRSGVLAVRPPYYLGGDGPYSEGVPGFAAPDHVLNSY